jgi:hypothetical protein
MNTRLAFSLLCLVLYSCSVKPTSIPLVSTQQMDQEEQAVYSAVLLKIYSASNYVIMDFTTTGLNGTQEMSATLDRVLLNMHDVAPETATDFRARNDTAYPLRPDMEIGAGYVLLNQHDRSQLFNQNQDGWQLFYEKYPDAPGITTLSRVGFNNTLDQALVYAGMQSQWLAGAGYYLLLNKVNGAWIVEQQVMTWIS